LWFSELSRENSTAHDSVSQRPRKLHHHSVKMIVCERCCDEDPEFAHVVRSQASNPFHENKRYLPYLLCSCLIFLRMARV